jgi:hydroxymethylglutaryl-CoA reductase
MREPVPAAMLIANDWRAASLTAGEIGSRAVQGDTCTQYADCCM